MEMHEEWYVGVLKRFQVKRGENQYYNALGLQPGYERKKYLRTEEEAREALDKALKLWNGEKVYDDKGLRRQRIGGSIVTNTRESDRQQEIVKYIIKKRVVTDWETVDGTTIKPNK